MRKTARRQSRTAARGAALAGFATLICLGLSSALAQADRAAEPDFPRAWIAYQEGEQEYLDCVDAVKTSAVTDMWTRRAPLEGAIYEISRAYRSCEGFGVFWNELYFAGFDSPEQWIEYELMMAKHAVLSQTETELEDVRRMERLLNEAVAATTDIDLADREQRLRARDALLAHLHVARAVSPKRSPSEAEAELIESYAELLSGFLPGQSLDELNAMVQAASGYRRGEDIATNVVNGLEDY